MGRIGGIEVRRAGPDDLPVLSELQWRWRVEEWSGEPAVDRAWFAEAMRGWVTERPGSRAAFVATAGGAPVGMAWLTAIERVPTPMRLNRRLGLVESVYVLPEVRDQGAGSALLTRLVDEARRLGFDHLLVHPSDRSVPLYRRLGFGGEGYFLELRLAEEAEPEP
ncbi:MAG TPA: GNAT family N-acetyltransferase [Candidatus Dormibacteraeota bacterium]|nr:GNAT family N-acetyltransferase [Candidatus Dormibacteraeota bacterium]